MNYLSDDSRLLEYHLMHSEIISVQEMADLDHYNSLTVVLMIQLCIDVHRSYLPESWDSVILNDRGHT